MTTVVVRAGGLMPKVILDLLVQCICMYMYLLNKQVCPFALLHKAVSANDLQVSVMLWLVGVMCRAQLVWGRLHNIR